MKEVKDVSAEVKSSFLQSGVNGYDGGSLVARHHSHICHWIKWFLFNDLRYHLLNASIADLFPNLGKVDFPFIILILLAKLFDTIADFLFIKAEFGSLSVKCFVELSFDSILEEAEEMVELILLLLDDTAHSFVEIFDEKSILMMLLDCFFVYVCHFFLFLEYQMWQFFVLFVLLYFLLHLRLKLILNIF